MRRGSASWPGASRVKPSGWGYSRHGTGGEGGFQADRQASEREAGRAKRARRLLVAFSRVGAFARSRSSVVSLPFAGRLDAVP